MTLDTAEAQPPGEGSGLTKDQAGGQVETIVRCDPAERLYSLAMAAAELLDDIEGQHRREDDAFALGYRLGFAAGRDVGHHQAETEMARAWARLAAYVRSMASVPTFAELQERRHGKRRAA